MDTAKKTSQDSVYVRVVNESAESMIRVINESIEIINKSQNLDTKLSRLGVAKDKIQMLKQLAEQHPFIDISGNEELISELDQLEHEFNLRHYQEAADDNTLGNQLEKEGQSDEAIHVYENLVQLKVDTPHTYRRLAIIYKKMKRREDEIRVLEAALKNVPVTNKKHYQWFQDRLSKFEV